MYNTTENRTSSQESIIPTTALVVLSTTGISGYLLVLFVILRNPLKFGNPFFYHLISLTVSDVICLTVVLSYWVPLTLTQRLLFGDNFDLAMGAVFLVGYMSSLSNIIAIVLNRYCGVCKTESYNSVFSNRKVGIYLILIWVSAITLTIPHVMGVVRLYYSYGDFEWTCDTSLPYAIWWIWFERTYAIITCIIVIVCYSFFFTHIHHQFRAVQESSSQNSNSELKEEINLSRTFLPVAAYWVIFQLLSTFLPMFTTGRWQIYLLSGLLIGSFTIKPYIYILVNDQIGQQLTNLVKCKEDEEESTDNFVANSNVRPASAPVTSVGGVNLYLVQPQNRAAKYNARADLAIIRLKIQEAKQAEESQL